ncbi:MAG: hypothetical protein JWO22_1357 [Frankiales bacterium]|nr:hypothetical protein [Frankiales bacterium]
MVPGSFEGSWWPLRARSARPHQLCGVIRGERAVAGAWMQLVVVIELDPETCTRPPPCPASAAPASSTSRTSASPSSCRGSGSPSSTSPTGAAASTRTPAKPTSGRDTPPTTAPSRRRSTRRSWPAPSSCPACGCFDIHDPAHPSEIGYFKPPVHPGTASGTPVTREGSDDVLACLRSCQARDLVLGQQPRVLRRQAQPPTAAPSRTATPGAGAPDAGQRPGHAPPLGRSLAITGADDDIAILAGICLAFAALARVRRR